MRISEKLSYSFKFLALIIISPLSCVSKVPNKLKSVDFPDPEGPYIVKIDPFFKSKEIPFKTSSVLFPSL